jgi:hypothetical protein
MVDEKHKMLHDEDYEMIQEAIRHLFSKEDQQEYPGKSDIEENLENDL